jgi:excisionase family DNA binding protein
MSLTKAKSKKTSVKKNGTFLVEKNLKKIRAQELRQRLSKSKRPVFILLDNEKFELQDVVRKQLIEALMQSASIKPMKREVPVLSTTEVAQMLNVSRPFVVKLIETNQLKSFMVGSHRRVLETDALEFKRKMRSEQNKALDALADETEKLGLDFE